MAKFQVGDTIKHMNGTTIYVVAAIGRCSYLLGYTDLYLGAYQEHSSEITSTDRDFSYYVSKPGLVSPQNLYNNSNAHPFSYSVGVPVQQTAPNRGAFIDEVFGAPIESTERKRKACNCNSPNHPSWCNWNDYED